MIKQIVCFIFLVFPSLLYAEGSFTLEKIVESIVSDNNVINAKKQYELSAIHKRYQYLQWWLPSFTLSNSLAYPYENDEFDDKATSDETSLDLAIPLPTGSIINLSGSYSLARDLLETSTLDKKEWGFTQDLQFSVSLSQSLNPWWIHSNKNPYNRAAVIQRTLSKNDYNGTVKDILFSSISTYIRLRKIERNSTQINDTLEMYDELLAAHRTLYTSGSISWRDYEKTRMEKWEYESNLFSLENDKLAAQGDLYKLTGIVIENVSSESLLSPESPVFMQLFYDVQKQELYNLEETSIILQRENLKMNRLLNRQNNAPKIKILWGAQYKLPIKPDDSLWDAWTEGDNWDDNIKNNWSVSLLLDLSSLLSPVNLKDTRQYNEETRSLEELLKSVKIAKQNDITLNKMTIKKLEEQISRLTLIVENENIRVKEDELLKDRGVITAIDYRQEQVACSGKQTLLYNLQDDLWFYRFIMSFY
jgi:hypothetical protein